MTGVRVAGIALLAVVGSLAAGGGSATATPTTSAVTFGGVSEFTVTTPGGTATSKSQFVVTGSSGLLTPPPVMSLKLLDSTRARHRTTETVTAHFDASKEAQLGLSVLPLSGGRKITLLKGSRLVGTKLPRRGLFIKAFVDQAGPYALRLILGRHGLVHEKTYVIRLRAVATAGSQASTLSIPFRA